LYGSLSNSLRLHRRQRREPRYICALLQTTGMTMRRCLEL
jgi:hypothetical protein